MVGGCALRRYYPEVWKVPFAQPRYPPQDARGRFTLLGATRQRRNQQNCRLCHRRALR